MAFKSILLLGLFLVFATKVFSHDEDLNIVVNYVNGSPQIPAPASPVKSPSSSPQVKAPPPSTYPSVKPPSSAPQVKVPPPSTYPSVKPPSSGPQVKAPPSPYPSVKPPTTTPSVKVPPNPTIPTPPITLPPVGLPPLPSPPVPTVKSKKDCIPLCDYRCQLHSRKRLCMRACMTCCDRCKCVPPGTYGNREKCGKCYTDMLTHGNKFKCP